jgi:hypothetical protein
MKVAINFDLMRPFSIFASVKTRSAMTFETKFATCSALLEQINAALEKMSVGTDPKAN